MGKHYIVIAEDDNDDCYLVKTALEDIRFEADIIYTKNGIELLAHLESAIQNKTNYPIFILLDLNMPKMDGREVLKRIKSDILFKAIPVIVFSITRNQSEVKHCYDLGANTFIVKPAYYHQLVDTMKAICNYWLNIAVAVKQG